VEGLKEREEGREKKEEKGEDCEVEESRSVRGSRKTKVW
jgi:hypothetical protein